MAAGKESNKVSLITDPIIYDVTLFSGMTCKAYVYDLISRINNWSDNFAEFMQKIKNDRDLTIYGTGGINNDLQELFHIVSKCTLGIEMLYSKTQNIEDELLLKYKEKINQLSKTLDQIKKTGFLLKKDDINFTTTITQALGVLP